MSDLEQIILAARDEFRDPIASAAAFAYKHGIKRTTATGWKKKVQAHEHLHGKGRPRKIGPFEETDCLKRIVESGRLVDVKELMKNRGLLPEPLSKPTIRRILQRMELQAANKGQVTTGGPSRSVTIRAMTWEQPSETTEAGNSPLVGVLWQMVTGKGVMAFMLTKDSSAASVSQVADALIARVGSRKRNMVTDNPMLFENLRSKLPSWRITVE